MTRRVRVGIVGTGGIADEFAEALAQSERCIAQAVASRDKTRAAAFAERHGIATAHDGLDALLASAEVDLVYVATPHPQHLPVSLAAVKAGKHVVCEKPITLDTAGAERLITAAREAGVMLVEAFAYRFHPQTHALLGLVSEGAIGKIRLVRVAFGYEMPDAESTRVLRRADGGGGILDVGCYCTAMAADVVAAATGAADPEPVSLQAVAQLHPEEHTDELAGAALLYESGIMALISCGVTMWQDNEILVEGEGGQIRVEHPCWVDGRRKAASVIEVRSADGSLRRVEIPGGKHIFAIEVDGVAGLLDAGPEAWQATWSETLANMRTLDRWRAATGVRYGDDTN